MEFIPSQSHQQIDSLPRSQADLRYRINSRLAQPWLIRLVLKLFSAQRLGEGTRNRWQVAGIPRADLEAVLPTIRTMEDWWRNWRAHAEQCEAEAHEALRSGRRLNATEKFLQAYALYSIATQGLYAQPERLAEVSRKMVEAYAQAAPNLDPPAQRVEIPFAEAKLAGYLRIPTYSLGSMSLSRMLNPSKKRSRRRVEGKYPIVLLSNGAGGAKEDMRVLEEQFLVRGMAILSVDGPGVGESWEQMGWLAEQERVAEAKLKFLTTCVEARRVDLSRVGLFGFSLGGFASLRMASQLHEFKAVAAVCPPYDGPAYFDVVPQFVRETVRHMSRVDPAVIDAALPGLTLRGHIQNIRCPIFVVGVGKDTIVPGNDAQLIVQEATCEKELLWYPDDEHGAPQHLQEWQSKVAEWMAKQLV